MRLLLDSHTLIWYLNGDPQLSANAHALLSDTANERWVSAASIWEIAIKVNLGKLALNRPLPAVRIFLATNNFLWLPIEFDHALQAAGLPLLHRDPFDRMLIAQALAEQLTAVTRDPWFARYGVPVVW